MHRHFLFAFVISIAAAACSAPPSPSADASIASSDLLALTEGCSDRLGGDYATDVGEVANISICGLPGAVYWHADLDVDCDGRESAQCNLNTDPAYQSETSVTDSQDRPLDAATLPYVVIPLGSARFDYVQAEIELGAVVAVIYDGKVAFGVFGDEGPEDIIGEASYAMAGLLDIDPDPESGGAEDGATYIVFTGPDALVEPIEDHAAASLLGLEKVQSLLAH